MDEKVLDELVSFLTPAMSPPLREKALEYIVGLSGSSEGLNALKPCLSTVILALVDLTDDENNSFVEDVFKALVNLCAVDGASPKITENVKVVSKLLKMTCDSTFPFADQASAVLSNLSRDSQSCQHILNSLESDRKAPEKIDLAKLVEVACRDGHNPKAKLHSLVSVIANLTQLPDARKFVLNKDGCVIQRLLPYTQFMASDVRRRGVVTILKNCCFETEYHEWLLSDAVDILPYLLLPLAGPEELDEDDMEGMPEDLQYLGEDKEREPEPAIRKLLIETITKLCTTKPGRDIVKAKRTYIIMREYDSWEGNEHLKDIAHDLIQILIGDEPEQGMENLEQVEIPQDIKERFEKMDSEKPKLEDDHISDKGS